MKRTRPMPSNRFIIFWLSLISMMQSPVSSFASSTKPKSANTALASKFSSKITMEDKNHLSSEKSPYLLQHKNNPVWWYPWTEEAFLKAKKENKPIFLSVGYATCHWCHVMEGDSFEKEEVAKILNKNFISIKVDREERPDVDSIYMTAVQAMTGRGGWPMSVILTPDLKPFFGGTFIPREKFIKLLLQVSSMWNSDQKQELLKSSEELTAHLFKITNPKKIVGVKLGNEILTEFFSQMKKSFDPVNGGFGKAPKFPSAMSLMTLARVHKRTGNKESLKFYSETLDKMARGGMYDQIGGGFHRYSTDEKWLVPHFEKMLYDNALLILTYLEAYQITGNNEYKTIAEETINYIHRDLTSENGGFFTAEDADSEKAEGKFYVWQDTELRKVLTASEYTLASKTYGITKNGNFDTGEFSKIEKDAGLKGVHHANILNIAFNKNLPDYKSKNLKSLRAKLLKIRSKRIRPFLDTKILTSWNGLMIFSMAKAARAFSNKEYLSYAENAASFVMENLYIDGVLYRRYAGGESAKRANLEDYSYLIYGLIELYQSSYNSEWLERAIALQKVQDSLFWDSKDEAYFDTDGVDKSLLLRTKDFYDNATPSGNSIAAINLLKLKDLTYQKKYLIKAEKILKRSAGQMKRYPGGFSMMLVALDYYLDSSKEIAIIGKSNKFVSIDDLEKEENKRLKSILETLNKKFLPNMVLAVSSKKGEFQVPLLERKILMKGETTVYVCEEKICKIPTTDPLKALKLASSHQPFNIK